MSPFLDPGETTPAVRTATAGTPETMQEMLSPPAEETTPGPSPRTRSRRPSPRPNPDGSDPDLPPEPTAIPEAEGRRTTGGTTTRRRAATRASGPSRPRRPPVNDDAVGWQDAGASEARTRDAFDRLAEAGEAGARRRGPATAKHWEDFLTVLLGFLSMIYCWWLLAGLEVPKTERDSLMLQEDEAEGLATPMARILARSWLNQSYGKHVLGASDYVVMAISLAEYGRRTHPYLRRRLGTLVPGRAKSAPRPAVDEAALRRRAAEERNGHNVDGAPARPAGPIIFPAQAT